ncbi:O-antigen ligase family protein [Thermobrachium celere]|uniref:O-antigen ligase family protein n=1 Tax=Thermobrachium celere TaxID=53422 RepID=UPI001940BA8B|nr:O-antigen ligase family protein [Thermobrachium celere]GFR36233.1 hypothetical protein TCEA9_20450 [Thermobrachium celere]
MYHEHKDKMLKFIFILILINPILDLLTGIYLKTFNLDPRFTPGIIIRNLFLLYMVYYIFKKRINVYYYVMLIITFFITIIVQFYSGITVYALKEIQYYLKFIYNISILLIGLDVFKTVNKTEINKLIRYFTISSFFYAVVIVSSFLLGIGYKTYSYSSASKGFFLCW